ncbi:MAG: hypothetical protein KAW41_00445 [Candidatus Diapherotrites archaeon]|nr:hypothetical protein [Candidatus Diapherotrites archaeon]
MGKAKKCTAAICEFELAAMLLILVSWLYILLVYIETSPYTPLWFAWWVAFAASVYHLFSARGRMKKALAAL